MTRTKARGGVTATGTEPELTSRLFASSDFNGVLEAAFLLKSTGIPLASWTRKPVAQDVVGVMAATMWGSLDTLLSTLGGPRARSFFVEIADRRLFAVQVEPSEMLLLIAPRDVGRRILRHEAQRILNGLAAAPERLASHHATAGTRG